MASQPNHRSVISVGLFPKLLYLREQILSKAGYAVFTTSDPKQAEAKIIHDNCGVLLLCYSIEGKWRERLIARFREHRPQGRIIAITNHPVAESPVEVDELVYGVEGPEALMDAIERKAA